MILLGFAAQRLRRRAWLALSALLVGCTPLPELVETGCGDRVLGNAEDCDGASLVEGGVTFTCVPRDLAGACHFQASDGQCPTGFRAGGDGICRKPSGTFETGAIFPTVARNAVPVDYDGDGRTDLFVQGDNGDELVSFDGRTPVPLGFSFSPYEGATDGVAGDLTGDGLDDVLEPLNSSLLTFEGASFGLRTYASDDPGAAFRVVPVDAPALAPVDPDASSHPDLDVFARLMDCSAPGTAQALCSATGAASLLFTKSELGIPTPLLNGGLTRPFADIGAITRAKLSATRSCRDVVLASVAHAEVDVVPVCGACDPVCTPYPVATIALSDPSALDCPNLVPLAAFVAPSSASSTDTVWIEGKCADDRHALYTLTATAGGMDVAHRFDVPSAVAGQFGPTDALVSDVADLDADGFVDLIVGNELYLSGGAELSTKGMAAYIGDWFASKIVDVNADGYLDIVAARTTNGVEVLLGGPFSAFAPGLIPTTSVVHALAVGDFDGDGTPDVFIAEGGIPCGANDSLSVAFGRFHGFPEPPTPIGEAPWAAQIVSGRVYRSPLDSISDVTMVSVCESTALHAAAAFTGTSSRVLSSPYELRLPSAGGEDPSDFTPEALAIADVAGASGPGSDGSPDIVAIGPGSAPTLLVVPGTSGAGLTPTSGIFPAHQVRLPALALDFSRPTIAVADIEGDAAPEILVGGTHFQEMGSVGDLFVISAQTFQSGTVGSTAPFGSSDPLIYGGATTVGAADVDGDGDLDAVALVTESTDETVATGTKEDFVPKSQLLFAEHSGAELLAVCRVDAPQATAMTGFRSIDLGGPAPALLIATSRGILRYEAVSGALCNGTFESLADVNVAPDALLESANGIVSADFDGDGLEDLGVLTLSGIAFLHQLPTTLGDSRKVSER
ncbi:MAG: VCBS repeat-containing protein [Polyangiaceae bacterium]